MTSLATSALVPTPSALVDVDSGTATFMDPDIVLLRSERDWVARHSGMAALAALHADSSRPLADLVRRSEATRAMVRDALRPFMLVNRAIVSAVGN